jgi:hypothetical protein
MRKMSNYSNINWNIYRRYFHGLFGVVHVRKPTVMPFLPYLRPAREDIHVVGNCMH